MTDRKTETLKCKRCKHQWIYRGNKVVQEYPVYISCPRCRTSIPLSKLKGGVDR